MKTLITYMMLLFILPLGVQEMTVNNKGTELTIFGTSSIHDWEIEAENCKGVANINIEEGQLKDIQELSFKVEVASLESGKSAMDDNTVEALKGKKHPYITYKLSNVQELSGSGVNKVFNSTGILNIAGVSKQINMKVSSEGTPNSIDFVGEVKFKMTDFGVDPPTAIFGTITTGDNVKIKFKTNYTLTNK